MAKFIRVAFKLFDILLLAAICVFVLLPKDLVFEADSTNKDVAGCEQGTIEPKHLFCQPISGTYVSPTKEITDKILCWKPEDGKNVTSKQFLQTIACLNDKKGNDTRTKEKCFCVGPTLWILLMVVVLAGACAAALIVELFVVILSDESSRGFVVAGVCSVVTLLSWSFGAVLLLIFVMLRWPFKYVTRNGDKKNYYGIPSHYYIALGMSFFYVVVAFLEAGLYFALAARRNRDSPSIAAENEPGTGKGRGAGSGGRNVVVLDNRSKRPKTSSDNITLQPGGVVRNESLSNQSHSGRREVQKVSGSRSNIMLKPTTDQQQSSHRR